MQIDLEARKSGNRHGRTAMHKECLDGDRLFVIHDFLSAAECCSFVARSEETGYDVASITTEAGPVIIPEIRNNARLIADDRALAEFLWRRAQPFVPQTIGSWRAIGLNDRFRFYRYDVGQQFAMHYDGCFRRGDAEQSQLTFMVYLNADCTGGETKFYRDDRTRDVVVNPTRGTALVFNHLRLHEGAPVLEGRKYVLRTDVMYAVVV